MLKVVDEDSNESHISSFLSSQELANDPANHCIPILDIIKDESEQDREFLVMPVLRPFNQPPFFSVEEILEFVEQILEVSFSYCTSCELMGT